MPDLLTINLSHTCAHTKCQVKNRCPTNSNMSTQREKTLFIHWTLNKGSHKSASVDIIMNLGRSTSALFDIEMLSRPVQFSSHVNQKWKLSLSNFTIYHIYTCISYVRIYIYHYNIEFIFYLFYFFKLVASNTWAA